jgi:predicted amidohydrolase
VKKTINISLIQSNIFWQNVNKNLSNLSNLISRIKKTDLILLPEMFNTAFCPSSNYLAEKMNGETVNWMKKISKQKKCAISGSLMIQVEKKIYNRLIWITKNGEINTYDKRHLFSLIKEHKLLSKGKDRLVVELEGWKICPLICYDLRFPVFSRNNINYDILIYLANWPVKRIDAWDILLKARAIENQCYTIGVNRVGKDGNGFFFNGHSKVFDAFGKELSSLPENKEDILQIDISIEDLNHKRSQMNFLQDRDNFTLQ